VWRHPDGRLVSIPIHGSRDIGGGLFFKILRQLGLDENQFRALK
jgi:predicted RNA binding protein YcfA (HicA-like mRNA interferase family)